MGIPGISLSDHTYRPVDRVYNFGDNPNIATLGACSYISEIKLDFAKVERCHALMGRFCSISSNIAFIAGQNHSYRNSVTTFPFYSALYVNPILAQLGKEPIPSDPYSNTRDNHYQIIVGNDVWIGRSATIMGGVKIGSGAIIGTRAVVTKDVPPYAIVAGNPARVVKYRFDEETIKKFMAIKWWNWSVEKVLENLPLMNDAEKFLAKHYSPALDKVPDQNGGGTNLKNIAKAA